MSATLRARRAPPMPLKTAPTDLKTRIVKLTGIVLVLPALLNAGYDLYAVALKLPRTDAEKVNTEMFKKYFNREPIATLPVPVKNSGGTVDARFAIYEGGEIFVEYGGYSQWFPFPRAEPPKHAGLGLIPNANAQSASMTPNAPNAPIASQNETLSGTTLTRTRVYADGRVERRKIDTRSGATLSVDWGSIPRASVPTPSNPPRTWRIEPIELRR